jgi:iron complex outermembrane recepter protein
VFTGNPLLRPTITNNLKAGYIYKGYSLSVLLDRDDYPIARYQVVKSTGGDLVYIAPRICNTRITLVLEMRLPGSFSVEISGWYNSSTYSGSKTVQGVGALNGGIKKELKNNWGSLQLVMTDILRTSTFVSAFGAITQEAFNLKSSIIYNPESRRYQVIKLTYSKSFGNSTVKSRRTDVNGSMDERDRIRRN